MGTLRAGTTPVEMLRRPQDCDLAGWNRNFDPVAAVALGAAGSFFVLAALALSGAMPVGKMLLPLTRCLVLGAAAVYYLLVRFHPTIAVICVALLAWSIGSRFGFDAGYGVHFLAREFPLADPWLAAADRWLGFDWRSMLAGLDEHPVLAEWLRFSYAGCGLQGVLALGVLAGTGQHQRLLTLIAANFLALIVVHVVAVFLPALGPYGYFGAAASQYPHLDLASAADVVPPIMALRQEAALILPAGHLLGLVTFPSYHAVVAVGCAWAFWRTRCLRWPALAFNFGVLVSALPYGSHYLVDLIAGVAVAFLSIWAVRRLAERLHANRPAFAVSASASGRSGATAYFPAAGPVKD